MSLYERIRAYLEERGWYWDEHHFRYVWGRPSDPDDRLKYHCWTLPQWGEYWSSDHLESKGPKPKTRRYESFQDALWSQVCREQWPDQFEMFFNIGSEED